VRLPSSTSCWERHFRDFNRMQIKSEHGNQVQNTILISTVQYLGCTDIVRSVYESGTISNQSHTAHSAQQTAHSAQQTPHSTQHTAHSTQRTAHSTQQTAHGQTVMISQLSVCCSACCLSLSHCCITLVHVCNSRDYKSDQRLLGISSFCRVLRLSHPITIWALLDVRAYLAKKAPKA
jgi:hypothetical protein